MAKKKEETKDITVEEKLRALYTLQCIDTEVDKIRNLRGELPHEVQDLEDEIEGLQTRLDHHNEELEDLDKMLSKRRNEITEAEGLIKKYKEQQNSVRNNREFDALSKEIEYQELEIQLLEKKIKEHDETIKNKKVALERAKEDISDRQLDLENKKKELDGIVTDTEKEENNLLKKSEEIRKKIEERLSTAYKKIRKNARNKVAVASVQRDACGGCFNKIPPQRQLDVRNRKKIIVCEYCGRILVDDVIADSVV
jgi:predicted  nucleic acid-binding Zn-ribbon protein